MLRAFSIVLCSVPVMVTACKADRPAGTSQAPVAKAADPGLPAATRPEPATPESPGPAKPADPAATPGNSELEAKGIAMTQRMADLFVADAKDCEKMAIDVRAFTAQNRALLDQLADMEKHQTPQEREAFERRNRPVVEALLKKVTPAMTACRDNKNVEAAMAALGPPEP